MEVLLSLALRFSRFLLVPRASSDGTSGHIRMYTENVHVDYYGPLVLL